MNDNKTCCVKGCGNPRAQTKDGRSYPRCAGHLKEQWEYHQHPTRASAYQPAVRSKMTRRAPVVARAPAAPVRTNVCPLCKRTARASAELALAEGIFCPGCAASIGAARRILISHPPEQPMRVDAPDGGSQLKLALIHSGRNSDTSYKVRRCTVVVLEEVDETIPATSEFASARERLLSDGFTVYHEF